jgi:hypothetical protein
MMNRSSAPRRRITGQQQVTRMIEEVGARASPVYRDDDVESDISASEALYSTRDGNDDSTKQEAMSIARTETKVVRSLKLFMLGILLISSIGVATAVYFYTNDSEQQQFQIAFNENSRKVLEVRRMHTLALLVQHRYDAPKERFLHLTSHTGHGTLLGSYTGNH